MVVQNLHFYVFLNLKIKKKIPFKSNVLSVHWQQWENQLHLRIFQNLKYALVCKYIISDYEPEFMSV